MNCNDGRGSRRRRVGPLRPRRAAEGCWLRLWSGLRVVLASNRLGRRNDDARRWLSEADVDQPRDAVTGPRDVDPQAAQQAQDEAALNDNDRGKRDEALPRSNLCKGGHRSPALTLNGNSSADEQCSRGRSRGRQ